MMKRDPAICADGFQHNWHHFKRLCIDVRQCKKCTAEEVYDGDRYVAYDDDEGVYVHAALTARRAGL